MADIVVTAASVVAGANARKGDGFAGETIAAGKMICQDPASKKWVLADSNSANVWQRKATAMALNSASLNQPIAYMKWGDVNLGTAVLAAGTAYYLSDTPGGICVLGDVGAGEYVCLLGLAKTAQILALDIQFPGVAN